MEKRGQVSVELLFSLGILALVFSAMMAYAASRERVIRGFDDVDLQLRECNALVNAIVGTLLNPGSEVTLDIRRDFQIKAGPQVITMAEDASCRIPTASVTGGHFVEGTIIVSSLSNGSVEVRND